MNIEANKVTEQEPSNDFWFYEEEGQRKGAISNSEIFDLIESGKLTYGALVWKKGFADWMRLENTELKVHLKEITTPPPISGGNIKNGLVWILAFAPIIGLLLEYFVSSISANIEWEFLGEDRIRHYALVGLAERQYWYVTLIFNIALSYADSTVLKRAGYNTDKFKGWVWLVPVYLYQRATHLKQNLAYFIAWIICFFLVFLAL